MNSKIFLSWFINLLGLYLNYTIKICDNVENLSLHKFIDRDILQKQNMN